MATVSNRTGLGWGTRLLLSLALILAGAAGAAWALARYDAAARFLGVSAGAGIGERRSSRRLTDARAGASSASTRIRRDRQPGESPLQSGDHPRSVSKGRPAVPMHCLLPSRRAVQSIVALRSAISNRCCSTVSAKATLGRWRPSSRALIRAGSPQRPHRAVSRSWSFSPLRWIGRGCVDSIETRARVVNPDQKVGSPVDAAGCTLQPRIGLIARRRSRQGAGRNHAPARRRQRPTMGPPGAAICGGSPCAR